MENRQSEHIEIEAKKRAVRYHHLCIPTQQAMPGEQHVPHLGFSHVPGKTNAYGIEWVRFHEGADFPALIRERAHLAFEVASLDTMLLGERLIKAMQAGLDAGGEAGPVQSAGLLVVDKQSWPPVDLRCDWADAPIGELAKLWAVYAPQMDAYVTRALDPSSAPAFGVPGDPAR